MQLSNRNGPPAARKFPGDGLVVASTHSETRPQHDQWARFSLISLNSAITDDARSDRDRFCRTKFYLAGFFSLPLRAKDPDRSCGGISHRDMNPTTLHVEGARGWLGCATALFTGVMFDSAGLIVLSSAVVCGLGLGILTHA